MRKVLLKGLGYIGRFSQLARFGSFIVLGGIGLYAVFSEKKNKDTSIEKNNAESSASREIQQEVRVN